MMRSLSATSAESTTDEAAFNYRIDNAADEIVLTTTAESTTDEIWRATAAASTTTDGALTTCKIDDRR
jgi:hypothetical protein